MLISYSLITLILLSVYILFLLFLKHGFNKLNKAKQISWTPMISVIVCAHNEQKNLPDCINRLTTQKYDKQKVEFIIVNDRSTDRTVEIIESICQKDKRFTYIKITDRIAEFAPKKRAIDTAIQKARGQIILLTDADGRPGPNWIRKMVSYYTSDKDMVVGYAPYKVKPANHIPKQVLSLEYLSIAAVAAASTGIGYPLTCVGTNMSYRKKVYQEIGGFGKFKTHISGDDDLFLTLVREQKKYKIHYATDAETHVYNNPPQLWRKFLHQRMRYASKGFDYPKKVTVGLILYFLMNLLILTGLVSFPFDLKLFLAGVGLFAIKALFEYIFMHKAAKTLNDKRYLKMFPIAMFLHIPYVIIFGILGQFKHFRWVEDKTEAAVQKSTIPESVKNA
jgi:cellulose synthase/poly-beta-1,6-N-acetylglucosamine synthase-like glycosyltransferase